MLLTEAFTLPDSSRSLMILSTIDQGLKHTQTGSGLIRRTQWGVQPVQHQHERAHSTTSSPMGVGEIGLRTMLYTVAPGDLTGNLL